MGFQLNEIWDLNWAALSVDSFIHNRQTCYLLFWSDQLFKFVEQVCHRFWYFILICRAKKILHITSKVAFQQTANEQLQFLGPL